MKIPSHFYQFLFIQRLEVVPVHLCEVFFAQSIHSCLAKIAQLFFYITTHSHPYFYLYSKLEQTGGE